MSRPLTVLAVSVVALVLCACAPDPDTPEHAGTYVQSAVAVDRSTAATEIRSAALRHVLGDLEQVIATGGRHAVLLYTGNGSRHQVLSDVEIAPPDGADPVARAAQVKQIRAGTRLLAEQALGLRKASAPVARLLEASHRPGSDPAGMLGAAFERARREDRAVKRVHIVDDGLQNADGIDLAALIDDHRPAELAELLVPLAGRGDGIEVRFSALGATKYRGPQSRSRDIALQRTWRLVCRATGATRCTTSTT